MQRDATSAQIKAAYRKRVKETHPDAGGDSEEFVLVHAAYETLADDESRKTYDGGSGVGSGRSNEAVVPDVVGKKVLDAMAVMTSVGLVVRVVIVEVPANSPLSGRVVGQLPDPGQTTSGTVGLIVGVSSTSSLWARFRAGAIDLASGFWVGLKNSASTVTNRIEPIAIGAGSGLQRSGAVAGEVVGVLAIGAASAVANTAVTFFKIVAFFLYLIGFVIGLALLAAEPGAGLMVIGFLIITLVQSSKRKKARQRR